MLRHPFVQIAQDCDARVHLSISSIPTSVYLSTCSIANRLDVLAHHCNHQVEQTNGLNESETQNGVGEKLTTESWVAGDTEKESTEH